MFFFQALSRRIHYLTPDDVDEKFGIEKALNLLRGYAYVAVRLEEVCPELDEVYTTLRDAEDAGSNATDPLDQMPDYFGKTGAFFNCAVLIFRVL